MRYLDLAEPIRPLAVQPPLKVLVMISSPNDYPPLDAAGLAVLRFLAVQAQRAVVSRETLARQVPAELDHTLALLARRELIEPVDRGYRFQVELIRCWFVPREQ